MGLDGSAKSLNLSFFLLLLFFISINFFLSGAPPDGIRGIDGIRDTWVDSEQIMNSGRRFRTAAKMEPPSLINAVTRYEETAK